MVNKTKNDWVVVGRFGRVHGIKGLITLNSFTEPNENIFNYQPWYIQLKKNWCPIQLLQQQSSGTKILVQVENYLSREEAAYLTNMDIAVPRTVLPELELDHYYLHDLLGLNVVNLNQEQLGKVTEIIPTGANDVLVVSGKTRLLIPFVWEVYIKHINSATHEIVVDWNLDEPEQ